MTTELPFGLDWEVWRIYSAERFAVANPNDILDKWSYEQVLDAHAVLDMYEELEEKAAAAAQRT